MSVVRRGRSRLLSVAQHDRWSSPSTSTGLANVGIPAAGMVSAFALARNFDPALRGAFAVAQLLPLFGAAFASVGANTSLTYFLPNAKTKAEQRSLLRSAIELAALATLPILTIVVALGLLLSRRIAELDASTTLLCALYLPGAVGTLVLQGWLRGHDLIFRWNLIRVLPTAMWGLSAVAALLVGAGPDLAAALYSGSGLLGFFVALGACRGTGIRLRGAGADSRRSMFHYGSSTVIASIPRTVSVRLDTVLIATFLDATDAGIYILAATLIGVIPQLSTVRALTSFTVIASSSLAERRRVATGAILQALKVACGLGVLLALAAPTAIHGLFGEGYADGIPLSIALIPSGIFLAVSRAGSEVLLALGAPAWVLRIEIGGALVAIVTLAVLLPTLGLTGAVLSSTCAYLSTAVAGILLVRARTTVDAVSPNPLNV